MLSITQVLREADLHSETEHCCPIESKSGALSMDYNKRLGEVLVVVPAQCPSDDSGMFPAEGFSRVHVTMQFLVVFAIRLQVRNVHIVPSNH